MLYLRDEFFQHPKFEGWSAAERWRLLELMGYLSRYNNGSLGSGRVPTDPSLLPRDVTLRLLDKAIESGWIDRLEDGSLWFHNWSKYNVKDPTGAARQARYRAKRDVTRNGESDALPVTDGNASHRNAPSQSIEDTKSSMDGSTRSEEDWGTQTTPQQAASSALRCDFVYQWEDEEGDAHQAACDLEFKDEVALELHKRNVHGQRVEA